MATYMRFPEWGHVATREGEASAGPQAGITHLCSAKNSGQRADRGRGSKNIPSARNCIGQELEEEEMKEEEEAKVTTKGATLFSLSPQLTKRGRLSARGILMRAALVPPSNNNNK